ncbi:cleavage stimulation factor subunit 50-like isoform X2 [Dioscorea cayenensis subsp. rotundata]|uniref:Cleavage stimulation factor subunit 50-like isoform X2 n=1 Tax=Dioscorea cayennensis subsp. rotundata TaxID=55577 RepID=A0AB40APM6_DIOCR|nr:cleavage stimulation factor subunit 50-like isoform X2 [Dioscorea cayenensis subsp. rotundata]
MFTEETEKLQDDRDKLLSLALEVYWQCLAMGGKYGLRVEGKLIRQVNVLIVAHHDHNLYQAASVVALATMTLMLLQTGYFNMLQRVFQSREMKSQREHQFLNSLILLEQFLQASQMPVFTNVIDFSETQDMQGSSKSFLKHESRHVSGFDCLKFLQLREFNKQ